MIQQKIPIQIAIENIIQKKCVKCKKNADCKLINFYQNSETLTTKNLETIIKCFRYQKKAGKKYEL